MQKLPRKQKKELKKAQPLIIVFYVNVMNLDDADVKVYLEKITTLLVPDKKLTKEFVHYVVPVRGQETKNECINPVRISGKLFNTVKKQLEENQAKVDEILKNYNQNK